jgi:hypothetical protein
MDAAMGGFLMGQMFAGQIQNKPALLHFVSVRVDRTIDILDILKRVIRETFFEVPPETELNFEFTDKAELKVWKRAKPFIGEKPLFAFGLCGLTWTRKDNFFTLGLRTEIGAPIEMNIALLRHLLIHLDAKKVKYELW